MSGTNPEKAPLGQADTMDHYPPPPPGPPPTASGANPAAASASGAPHHPNEVPLPDTGYHVPAYDPAHPQYAHQQGTGPPRSDTFSDLYEEDERHPPVKPPRPVSMATTTAGAGSGAPVDAAGVPSGQAATKAGWADKFASLGMKAAAPINALAHKMGSESFLPSTMDKECEKAARILKAFCKDGIYTETGTAAPLSTPAADPDSKMAPAPAQDMAGAATKGSTEKPAKQAKNRTILHIPSKVISRAVGIAVFTTGRLGYGVSGATGSGVLIARLPDGSWSPPSGIQVHTLGAGFVIGVDIYDCVVVINSREALEAFTRTRLSLGTDLAVVAGPWGAGGSVDFAAPESQKGKGKGKKTGGAEGVSPVDSSVPPNMAGTNATNYPAPGSGPVPTHHQQQGLSPNTTTPTYEQPPALPPRQPSPLRQAISKPVFSYVKSRGFYAGVQVDGTVVNERKDANALFYGAKGITVGQILKGNVPRHSSSSAPASAAGGWERHARALWDVVKGAEGYRPGEVEAPTVLASQMNFGGQQQPLYGYDHGSAAFPPAASAAGYAPPPPHQPMTKEEEAAAEAAGAFAPPPPHLHPAVEGGGGNTSGLGRSPSTALGLGRSASTAHPPPTYSEFASGGAPEGAAAQQPGEQLPPAYVDDGQTRPPGDSKTGLH